MPAVLNVYYFLFIFLYFLDHAVGLGELIYAVNCGGPRHVDSYGIEYDADPLEGRVGVASDYGRRDRIGRVAEQDQLLYQTERWSEDTFGYEVPIEQEGDYVLVLKFAEVYFSASNMKVFDVVLNSQHTVVQELDIYDKVGRSTAHDEIIPFTVRKGKLMVQGEVSTFHGVLAVDLIKGLHDNPKLCALYVVKGSSDDVPKLPPIPGMEPDEEEELSRDKPDKARRTSGPKTPNPYDSDESSTMFPILMAIGVFLPTLFCLCRL
ncbi:PREDICTED: malectin-A-like [Branchiostoma belcheri]|uniref:Malectin-A-like n=1 Tax=Branchiostoma belcheri TaxID=7741 RepID=A0A6P4Z263_BRABE|nr:PREDICTED: malectin-A-like [Branchiostoma belcheri]KAI8494456.1 hypothetical protein Bbelb_276820 [Branchiostoma belcheri]